MSAHFKSQLLLRTTNKADTLITYLLTQDAASTLAVTVFLAYRKKFPALKIRTKKERKLAINCFLHHSPALFS